MFHLHYSDVLFRIYQFFLVHVYVPATGAVYILCFTCLNRLTIFFILSDQRLEHCSGSRIGSEEGPLSPARIRQDTWVLFKYGVQKKGSELPRSARAREHTHTHPFFLFVFQVIF